MRFVSSFRFLDERAALSQLGGDYLAARGYPNSASGKGFRR
jgi:hypothetical protein